MSNQEDGIYLSGFIWGSAKDYWPNIIRYISKHYQITFVKKYKFHTYKDLSNMIIKLYKHDNVSLSKIKKYKIKSLENYAPVCLNVQFYVPNPNLISGTRDMFEKDVFEMKKNIRKKYRNKVKNYVRDNIIHISDNQKQNKFIDNIINYQIIHD